MIVSDELPSRAAVKDQYGTFFVAVSRLLFDTDPIGINYETNTDEYDPETAAIIPRLHTANSAEDVERIVYEGFRHWFGSDVAGSRERYSAVSIRIWVAWCAYNASSEST